MRHVLNIKEFVRIHFREVMNRRLWSDQICVYNGMTVFEKGVYKSVVSRFASFSRNQEEIE